MERAKAHPARGIVGVDPAAPIGVAGYRAWCDVWAQDEIGLVLASFLGPHTALQSIWGYLMAGQTIELEGGVLLHRQHFSDEETGENEGKAKVRYLTLRARFPDIEQAHLLLVSELATLQVQPRQPGYFIAARPEGDAERFFAFWNRVVPLPARRDWSGYLWEEGLRRGCLREIAAYGCHGWAIDPDTEPWAQIVRWGIEERIIS